MLCIMQSHTNCQEMASQHTFKLACCSNWACMPTKLIHESTLSWRGLRWQRRVGAAGRHAARLFWLPGACAVSRRVVAAVGDALLLGRCLPGDGVGPLQARHLPWLGLPLLHVIILQHQLIPFIGSHDSFKHIVAVVDCIIVRLSTLSGGPRLSPGRQSEKPMCAGRQQGGYAEASPAGAWGPAAWRAPWRRRAAPPSARCLHPARCPRPGPTCPAPGPLAPPWRSGCARLMPASAAACTL